MALTFTIDDVAGLCHSRAHLEKGLRDVPQDEAGRMKLSDECRIPKGNNSARADDFERLYTAYKLVTRLAPGLCGAIAERVAKRVGVDVAAGATDAERLLATSRAAIANARHRPKEWTAQLDDYAAVCEEYTPKTRTIRPVPKQATAAPKLARDERALPERMQRRLDAPKPRERGARPAAAEPPTAPPAAPPVAAAPIIRKPGALFGAPKHVPESAPGTEEK